jgi:hypothetical protein
MKEKAAAALPSSSSLIRGRILLPLLVLGLVVLPQISPNGVGDLLLPVVGLLGKILAVGCWWSSMTVVLLVLIVVVVVFHSSRRVMVVIRAVVVEVVAVAVVISLVVVRRFFLRLSR